jgi:hypothetical protein
MLKGVFLAWQKLWFIHSVYRRVVIVIMGHWKTAIADIQIKGFHIVVVRFTIKQEISCEKPLRIGDTVPRKFQATIRRRRRLHHPRPQLMSATSGERWRDWATAHDSGAL